MRTYAKFEEGLIEISDFVFRSDGNVSFNATFTEFND